MNNLPDVTVGILIPTYNRSDLLDISINSALAQTYRNIKIIIIDNGNQQKNIKMIYENKDSRISYICNNNNIGMIGSINKGIELMPKEATWCTILCDDDALHVDYVKESLIAIKKYHVKTILDCHRTFININGNKISEALEAISEISATEYIKKRLEASRQTYLTGILFNRDAFEKIGGYPRFTTGMATDDAFIFSLSIEDRLVYSSKSKAYIRIHEGAESVSLQDVPLILESISEFKTYCQSKIKEIGFSSPKDADAFMTILGEYAARLNSNCWLKKAHDVSFSQKPNKHDLLQDLCCIVKKTNFPFSHRVYLDCFLFEKIGVFPEVSLIYRILWQLVEEGFKSFRRPRS